MTESSKLDRIRVGRATPELTADCCMPYIFTYSMFCYELWKNCTLHEHRWLKVTTLFCLIYIKKEILHINLKPYPDITKLKWIWRSGYVRLKLMLTEKVKKTI